MKGKFSFDIQRMHFSKFKELGEFIHPLESLNTKSLFYTETQLVAVKKRIATIDIILSVTSMFSKWEGEEIRWKNLEIVRFLKPQI